MKGQWCVILRRRYEDTIQGAVLVATEDEADALRGNVLALDGGEDTERLAVDVVYVDLSTPEGMMFAAEDILEDDDDLARQEAQ